MKVNRGQKKFSELERTTLIDSGWKEREDLQRMIRNSPEAFFAEMGEELLLIGEEIKPSDEVADRIDLLAIDPEGVTVILELKRGTNKLQLLQGLSYAAMVAKWDGTRFAVERTKLTNGSTDDVQGEIESFLVDDVDELNRSQRVVLIAEDFDYEVLITAEWLTNTAKLDIRCYRLQISVEANTEFLTCTCIYPPPEITGRGGSGGPKPKKWADWDEALSDVTNEAVVGFFRAEMNSGRDLSLRKRVIHFDVNGRRRLSVAARRSASYVWQNYRFEGDEEFWANKIGEHIKAEPVRRKGCLRFFLSSKDDFERFSVAVTKDLPKVEFLKRGDVPDELDDGDDDGDGD